MSTILIPGGAGYIGSHTVSALIDSGAKVVVIDNLETGYKASVHPGAEFHQGDIRDKAFLRAVLSKTKIDCVIHFAANSLVAESMENPLKYYDNNVNGTRILLEALVEHDIRRVVFSSTAAVYGEPKRVPISEDDPPSPTNCYGETKLAMERMFVWTERAHGLRWVSLRYFNACGARADGAIGESHEPETHLIPLVLRVPNGQSESIRINGNDYPTRDGTCVRDYIHVCDLAKAHILAAEYLIGGGESDVFNLGNGIGYTNREVVGAAAEVVGAAIPSMDAPRRPGDPATLVAGAEKAARVLGWTPDIPDIRDIIASAWKWHKSHPHGFRA